MSAASFEECRNMLEKRDRETRDERAKRRHELGGIVVNGQSGRCGQGYYYYEEAGDAYVNGNFRSTIFCCVCEVEQCFRFEYFEELGRRYEYLKTSTFGGLIRKSKEDSVPRLEPFLEKADLLNRMRNRVAVHPPFRDIPIRSATEKRLHDSLTREHASALLKLVGELDNDKRKQIETELIIMGDGSQCTFREAISEQSKLPDFPRGAWWLIEQDVLEFLANRAWRIMKEILEGLYPVEQI